MLPGLQTQAQGVAGQMQPGIGYANDVLGGQYLNSNPYTQGLMQQAGNDAANHANSTYSLAGRTGSGAAQTNLARGVDYAENQVGFQNYQNERGLQNNAAAMLPGLTAGQFSGYQPYLAATQLAGQLPYYGASTLASVPGMFNGYGTQTGTQTQGLGTMLGGVLGAGLAGWASGGFK